ncbi:hypothetical protein ACP4OV_012878 [Aristida adscensionis]
MAGVREGEAEAKALGFTPTWIVAAVCSVILLLSLVAERFLHRLGKTLKKRNQKPLYEAPLEVEEEEMHYTLVEPRDAYAEEVGDFMPGERSGQASTTNQQDGGAVFQTARIVRTESPNAMLKKCPCKDMHYALVEARDTYAEEVGDLIPGERSGQASTTHRQDRGAVF